MVEKLKKRINKRIQLIFRKVKLILSKKVYVSFGENCLTDNILDRYSLKSLTTPFSHGRSNIEYILQLEQDNYKDFLNLNFIKYEFLNKKEVPRLKKYNEIRNDYHELHKNGFEFTHHDVIKDDRVRLKISDRLQKLRYLIGRKKIIILYHHRNNVETNLELLLRDLAELKKVYSSSKINSEVVMFTQKIVLHASDRKLTYFKKFDIHNFLFHTMNNWEGDNPELLWATCDDDLIVQMINFLKKL